MANTIKCVVIGDGAVGKTCMLISYATNKFPIEYVPTVFSNYSTQLTVNNQLYTFNLYDTAGQEEYSHLAKLGYKGTDVFLVCFSVTNKSSFGNIIEKWLPELKAQCPGTPFILVGTQVDLRTNPEELEKLRSRMLHPISHEAGKDLAKKIKAVNYIECSALTQHGLKSVFDEAITVALNKDEKNSTSCSKCILQ